jgi:hypothetical protein
MPRADGRRQAVVNLNIEVMSVERTADTRDVNMLHTVIVTRAPCQPQNDGENAGQSAVLAAWGLKVIGAKVARN